MLTRSIAGFSRWFASPAGVWLTIILVAVLCILEALFPRADEHGFWLLYWLTVYSAVTQPALAYVGYSSGVKTDVVLNEELQLIREELQVLRSVATAVGA